MRMDDFSRLEDSRHMFEWFADAPEAAIRAQIEDMLCEQVAGSRLARIVVTSAPDWLTGGRRLDDDPGRMVLVRAAFAFECDLRAITSDGTAHDLSGVFTWAMTGMDEPGQARSRLWLDFDGDLTAFGSDGALQARVYFDREDADEDAFDAEDDVQRGT
jgi:hypothetical protein